MNAFGRIGLIVIASSVVTLLSGLALLILAGIRKIAPVIHGWNSLHLGTIIYFVGIVVFVASIVVVDRFGTQRTRQTTS